MKLKRLNGWQRLFVVVSVVWLVAALFMAEVLGVSGRNGLLFMIVPPFAVYLLWRSGGWVWQGFKSKGESE